jgi:hypothetical protein
VTVTRLAASPLLERIDGFVTEDEAASLFTLLEGLPLRHDETGHMAEVDALPELTDLEARVARAVGITPRVRSVRYRRYEVGEGHPLHADDYTIDGARLVATRDARPPRPPTKAAPPSSRSRSPTRSPSRRARAPS